MDFQKLLAGDEDAKAEFLSMDFDERTKTFGDYIKSIVGVRHFTPAEINGMAWPIWQVDNFDKQKPCGESNSMKVLRSFVSDLDKNILDADGRPDFKAEKRRSVLSVENLAACRRTLVTPILEWEGTLHLMPEPYSWHGLCLTNVDEAKLALERSDLSDGAKMVACATVFGYFCPELKTTFGKMLANWQPDVPPTPENLQKAQEILGLLENCEPVNESVCKAS
jgi:hypothetical protein